jgi:hypothetical protein
MKQVVLTICTFIHMDGKLVNPITKGNWDVVQLKGIDEKTKTAFSTLLQKPTANEKDIYSVSNWMAVQKTKVSAYKRQPCTRI